MNLQRVLTMWTIGLFLLAIPACKGGSDGSGTGKLKVGFVSNNPETFWTIVEAGCRKAEGESGVEVVFRRPQTGDPALQKEIIDILLSQDIKALAVSVIDPKGQRPYLDEI